MTHDKPNKTKFWQTAYDLVTFKAKTQTKVKKKKQTRKQKRKKLVVASM